MVNAPGAVKNYGIFGAQFYVLVTSYDRHFYNVSC